jgi:hypothetical protein
VNEPAGRKPFTRSWVGGSALEARPPEGIRQRAVRGSVVPTATLATLATLAPGSLAGAATSATTIPGRAGVARVAATPAGRPASGGHLVVQAQRQRDPLAREVDVEDLAPDDVARLDDLSWV